MKISIEFYHLFFYETTLGGVLDESSFKNIHFLLFLHVFVLFNKFL